MTILDGRLSCGGGSLLTSAALVVKDPDMLLLAGRNDPAAGAVFLLLWGLGGIIVGGAFATKRGAAAIRALVVNGLAQKSRKQAEAAASEGFLRLIGGFLVICGIVAVPVSLGMLTRG